MADILEPIKNIEVLRENLAQTSCVSKDAFMKLSDGEAPTLDYNLPQSSTYVTIPNNESIETIKFIGSKKSEYEMGIAIATDGSCSDIAYGSKDKISKEQWGKVLDKLRSEGKTIAYLIHSHPMDLTGAKIEVRDGRPSDVDYNTVFYEDNVGAIIWWKNVFNKPEKGYSHNRLDYRARISFYRQFEKLNGSLLELNTSIDDFADDFAKKW